MGKSWTFCLNVLTVILLLSCQERVWYERKFTDSEKRELARRFSKGADSYYQGSPANMALLEEGLRMDSTLPELWREMATPYLKRGMPYEAFRYYEKEVSLAPAEWQGWRGYLYLYFYRDYYRALADFNATDTLTSITDYPQGQSVDYMRGLCYYGLGDYEKAKSFFSRYINEVTTQRGEEWVDSYAFLYRGLTLEKLNRIDSALHDFDKGLRYNHLLSDFHYHRARVMLDHNVGTRRDIETFARNADHQFKSGYFHQRDYVEVHDQLYLEDIENLNRRIAKKE